ncbi:hypothetical protein SAMN05660772_02723 [Pasteurella testudinis DSM 23072]|uniref:Phage-related minor tail protein n=1 Tax=Pasteurella testudinis DSM 23072 TaxID=1122938 RepID=A0A1W1V1Z8_9PAST|nr:tail length tape measure protein [Pasteurella testudinis]SMB87345.1 hypothetical protein SAMN05660772_02723 [Pasteurella testudinis DSM 23072]SUB51641.1 tail length tape measure-related protein [Pasteurella testudinis]
MSETFSDLYIEVSMETAQLLQGATSADIALNKINESAKSASAGIHAAEKQAQKLSAELTKVAATTKNTGRAFGSMRGVIQGVGYQIQDVAVQAQMGTNAFVIMGQQGSQMLSLFGPMGAIAGMLLAIGGAMGTALLPNLFDSTSATDKLKDAQKKLGEVITENDGGILSLSDKMVKLAQRSEQAAKAKIAATMAESKQAIDAAGQAISEAMDDFDSFFSFLGGNSVASVSNAIAELEKYEKTGRNAAEAVRDLGGTYAGSIAEINNLTDVTSKMSEQLGITTTEAIGLLKQLSEFEKNKSPETMHSLAAALSVLSERYDNANPKLNELTGTVNSNAFAAMEAKDALDLMRKALADLAGIAVESEAALSGNLAKIEKITEAAREQAVTIGMTAREKAKYAAVTLGATKADLESIDASFDKIEAYKAEEEAAKQKREADKKAAREAESAAKKAAAEAKAAAKRDAQAKQQVIDQINKLSDQYEVAVLRQEGFHRQATILAAKQNAGAAATQAQVNAIGDLAAKMYDLTNTTRNFNALQAEISPTVALDQQHQVRMQQLDEYVIAYPAKIEEAEAVRAAIEEQYRQQRLEAQWDEWKQSSAGAEMFGNALEAVQSTASNQITGLLAGTTTLRDAFKSLSMTLLNSVVSSLIEVGMAQVKSMIIGRAAASAATAAQMAQAAALSAAFAPAAAMVSLATQGANAIPAQAGMASTTALAQTMSITGRKNGGPISANAMYRVGENNQPEIFKASNGSQYMIPGNSGRVFSNKDVTSNRGGNGGGSVTVIVNQTNHFGDQDSRGGDQQLAAKITDMIKGEVTNQIADQMRDGGMLAR